MSTSSNGLAALIAIQPIQPLTSSSGIGSLPAPELPNINNISEQSTNPLLSQNDANLLSIPSLTNTTPPYPPGETAANTVNSGSISSTVMNALGTPGLGLAGSNPTASSLLFGLSIGRIAAFILGLIFIAGGIYLFGRQPINDVIKAAVAV